MKPAAIVADEMFPEGAGPYMDIEEVCKAFWITVLYILLFNRWWTKKKLITEHMLTYQLITGPVQSLDLGTS